MTKTHRIKCMVILTAIIYSMAVPYIIGATVTWTGTVDDDWTNTANWGGNPLPAAGDNVVIPDVTNDPTIPAGTWPSETTRYGSFSISNGAVVTCLGDPTATNTASGGSDGNPHGIGVTIRCTEATISGTMNADLQGFPAGQGPGFSRSASYGADSSFSSAYGNLENPTALGSGSDTQYGGGAIAILATGTVTLNGTLSANGTGDNNRASSGGSVLVECDTFAGAGTGLISAEGGGKSGRTWAGTGGRVALIYETSTYDGKVNVVGGGNINWQWGTRGAAGTLWEPNRAWPRSGGMVTINGSYQYHFTNSPGSFVWDELVIDGAWFEIHGNPTIEIGSLTLTNNALFYWNDAGVTLSDTCEVHMSGSRISEFIMPSGEYSLSNITLHANAQLLPLGDVTATNTSSGGTAGEPHGAGVTIRCNNIEIAAGGKIEGSLYGFPESQKGPGRSLGAGYGGMGQTGSTYGRLSRPTALGSGGHVISGGGAIRLITDTMSFDGEINMNGGSSNNGSGAGGSVWIEAGIMTGNGIISAVGGSCTTLSRNGGGGRVAIEMGFGSTYESTNIFVNGGSYPSSSADTGTVFVATTSLNDVFGKSGSNISLESDYADNADSFGMKVTRTISEWGRSNYEWTDESLDAAGVEAINNEANYRLMGLFPGQVGMVYTNDVSIGNISADNSGILSVNNIALSPSTKVRIEFPAEGTLILIQ